MKTNNTKLTGQQQNKPCLWGIRSVVSEDRLKAVKRYIFLCFRQCNPPTRPSSQLPLLNADNPDAIVSYVLSIPKLQLSKLDLMFTHKPS
jgi:hypothetical protein